MAIVYDSWAVGGSSLNVKFKFAQTFVASDDYTLTRVDLALGSINTPANTFTTTITVHAVDGGHEPTGASLADMGSIASAGMGGLALRTFEDDSCNLTSGVEYAIVGTVTGDAGSLVRVDGSAGYANGVGWTQNIEDTWAAAGRDWYFRAIGVDVLPGKVTTPAPIDTHTDDKLGLSETTWVDGGFTDSYNVYFGATGSMELVGEEQADPSLRLDTGIILDYYTEYSWRVDSINVNGTTTGDVWTFTTIRFYPPLPTGVTLDDAGDPTGDPTGENAMIQVKRLVVAANNKIFYEDV